jgi:hypothetical protein
MGLLLKYLFDALVDPALVDLMQSLLHLRSGIFGAHLTDAKLKKVQIVDYTNNID